MNGYIGGACGFVISTLIVSTFVAIAVVHLNVFAGLLLQVAGLATVCFAASMVCHGKLERLKPVAAKLTSFYFIDAFASDSIPVHLLTTECFELYDRHLKKDGILITHITNRFVDLRPVIKQHAIEHQLTPILIDYHSADRQMETRWVLLTRNENVIQSTAVQSNQSPWPAKIKPVRWTDDYASVAALLK